MGYLLSIVRFIFHKILVRSILAIVPQNPELFEGTLRENIDPAGLYSDMDIWNALDQVHISQSIPFLRHSSRF